MKVRSLSTYLLERLTLAVVVDVTALALFVALAHEVHEGETRRFDAAAYHYFQAHQTPPLRLLMSTVSLLAGSGAILAAAAASLLLFWRKPPVRPDALSMLVTLGGGEGVVNGLKVLFHRARPSPVFAHLGYSFPSGHAFFAVTIYGMLAYWLARARPSHRHWVWSLMIAFILLIGFSRIYLGVHYASDVAAGFAVALPWLWVCLALPDVFEGKRPSGQGGPTP